MIRKGLRLAGGPWCIAALNDIDKKHPARAIQHAATDAISAIPLSVESAPGSRKDKGCGVYSRMASS